MRVIAMMCLVMSGCIAPECLECPEPEFQCYVPAGTYLDEIRHDWGTCPADRTDGIMRQGGALEVVSYQELECGFTTRHTYLDWVYHGVALVITRDASVDGMVEYHDYYWGMSDGTHCEDHFVVGIEI